MYGITLSAMNEKKNTLLAVSTGIIAALFLSSTFTINSLLAHTGGHWAWTASLRSLIMIPLMGLVLLMSKRLAPLIKTLKQHPILFLKWGIIGFGGLYTTMALASLYIPGWLVAATFQINILAGVLIAPFIYDDHRKKIPFKALCLSILIVIGVLVMQLDKLTQLHDRRSLAISFFLVLIGAFVWPLANRKLMIDLERKSAELNATQRVLGLTIGSTPLLLVLALFAYIVSGSAPMLQVKASFYSALLSGFIGGAGFYQATQMVKHNPIALATVEATQVFEIFFTLICEIWLVNAPKPNSLALIGMAIIGIGITIQIITAVKSSQLTAKPKQLGVLDNAIR